MKTIIISRISSTLLSLFIVGNLFAQKTDFKNEAAFKYSSYEINHRLSAFSNNSSGRTENINLNAKLLNNFKKQFQNVSDVEWVAVNNDFLATFKKDGMLTKSLFNKKGEIIYVIEFLTEKQLPTDVRSLVKRQYYDYMITSVAKVAENNREIWVIKMTGDLNYLTARVEDGEIEETENFKRAN